MRLSGDGPGRRRSACPDRDPVPVSEALTALTAKLGAAPAGVIAEIFGHWEDIVGPSVAAHVHPLRVNGERIVVGVDHPAWVTQLRHLAPQILERLAEVCGESEAPKTLDVRVRRPENRGG